MIFLGALFLRLLLMPVTMHSDLLFTNYFPYFFSSAGVWDIYGYFGGHYLAKEGYAYYAPLVYYLTGSAQWFLHALNPGFDFFMTHAHTLMYERLAGSIGDYLEPFSLRQRLQFVFMMKLPYLLADGLCVLFISMIFKDSARERRRALFFWLWSPVLIFSVYIFGTYRIYPALAVWIFIFMVQQNRKTWAAFFFGLLCLMDNFPWVLFAPVFLALGRDWPERARLSAVALLTFGAVFAPLYVSSHGYVIYAYVSPVLNKAVLQSLTGHSAVAFTLVMKAVFGVFYGGLLFKLSRLSRSALGTMDAARRTELVVWVSTAVLLFFYAASQTLAHYFMWVLPFFVILQAKGEPWKPAFTWALIALLFLFNLDKQTLNLGLLMPLDPSFFLSRPSLHDVMDRWLPWGKVVAASRLLFSLLCLEFVRRIFVLRIRPLLEGRDSL